MAGKNSDRETDEGMRKARDKPRPSLLEKTEYLRYVLERFPEERQERELKELRAKWGTAVVDGILADLKEEQKKGGGPKRYYVSLREPLEGFER